MAVNEFGFTNDQEDFRRVIIFRNAAVADGWICKPTYGEDENMLSAASLDKDGFHMSIISCEHEDTKWKYEVNISIWGPDGLAIKVPEKYDFASIQAGLRTCNVCNATDVDTQRYSFAGRCCAACRPEMARKTEYPGWCN